ncbi:2-oxoglutarate dehydrogenase E2 component [Humitalea rosea]|uniref:Dihydrolipoyllysine-residue succinyltransferase component of 2-oxoglutarate dehydrogenase complex n=1 Tax=Humitalea rosea TaxID=990373 RepID=A0A2W7IDP6_9PROT|nr:2-oxoglutarate dehydrogenase complex dihydrolipoyllysine-residue succinyltransferase [Humitalea rosea]PZW43165.1 2-oxoglutarate dehydrogenase E2 component [Humitalea rosea]
MTDILVPTLGESVSTATIARWLKKVGEAVAADEALVELETDKVTVEVNAPSAGVLESISAAEGAEVEPGAILGSIAAGAAAAAAPRVAPSEPTPATGAKAEPAVEPPRAPAGPVPRPGVEPMPAANKLMIENRLSAAQLGDGSGKDGRITKGDVLALLSRGPLPAAAPAAAAKAPRALDAGEERVKMTRLRLTIARRLKEAQNTAAMLTTFNEVDMSAAMALRSEYNEAFAKKYGIKLGFMSIFAKACIRALKEFPAVNAEIDGDSVIYKNFVNLGIAVGGPNGLVVPVLKGADAMSFADIEKGIANFGKRARDGQLAMDDLTGGSFTITNGGIYGSLMSTPILNPPQSGILGMHNIVERPIAVKGQVVIRPMMYVALSYDHRIVDGKEAVSFLVRLKEGVEDARRLLLDV